MRNKGLLFFLLLLSVLVGCDPKTRHRVSTVFFDGVPPLEEPRPREGTAPEGQENAGAPTKETPPPVTFIHKPYAENQCGACHSVTQGNVVSAAGELCSRCHQDAQSKGKVVHAPVAGGECLSCHSPHESPLEHLLKSPVPDLCMGCHEGGGEHVEEMKANKSVCTECHNPHSSDEASLLKH